MLIKTNELTGAALDWAVAKCEGKNWNLVESFLDYYDEGEMHYSTNWTQGGPIIEREKISLFEGVNDWSAKTSIDHPLWDVRWEGPTPLTAVMRCYVASKLGDEVEIPDSLRAPV